MPDLKLLFQDLTQLGLPKSQFSLINDETSYNYNPDRYNFYVNLLDNVSDPDQKIASKVFGILARNRRQHERIQEKIDHIASAITYLRSVYTRPDYVGGDDKDERNYGEIYNLAKDVNTRILGMPVIGKKEEILTDFTGLKQEEINKLKKENEEEGVAGTAKMEETTGEQTPYGYSSMIPDLAAAPAPPTEEKGREGAAEAASGPSSGPASASAATPAPAPPTEEKGREGAAEAASGPSSGPSSGPASASAATPAPAPPAPAPAPPTEEKGREGAAEAAQTSINNPVIDLSKLNEVHVAGDGWCLFHAVNGAIDKSFVKPQQDANQNEGEIKEGYKEAINLIKQVIDKQKSNNTAAIYKPFASRADNDNATFNKESITDVELYNLTIKNKGNLKYAEDTEVQTISTLLNRCIYIYNSNENADEYSNRWITYIPHLVDENLVSEQKLYDYSDINSCSDPIYLKYTNNNHYDFYINKTADRAPVNVTPFAKPVQQLSQLSQLQSSSTSLKPTISGDSTNIIKAILNLIEYKYKDTYIAPNGTTVSAKAANATQEGDNNIENLQEGIGAVIYNAIINPNKSVFLYNSTKHDEPITSEELNKILEDFMDNEIYRHDNIIYNTKHDNNTKFYNIFIYNITNTNFTITWHETDGEKIETRLRGILISMLLESELVDSPTEVHVKYITNQILPLILIGGKTIDDFKKIRVAYKPYKNSYEKFINKDYKDVFKDFENLKNLYGLNNKPKSTLDNPVLNPQSPPPKNTIVRPTKRGRKGGDWLDSAEPLDIIRQIGGSYFSERLNELNKVREKPDISRKEREAAEDDVVIEYKNNPLYSPDMENANYTDRIVFIAVTFMFRAISLVLVQSAINTQFITTFNKAFTYYFLIYSILFIIWILIVNMRKDSHIVGLLFYYVNANYDSSIWLTRITVHLLLQLLILPIPILLTPKFTSKSETDSFEKRERLYNTLTFFTFVIWIITSLVALRA